MPVQKSEIIPELLALCPELQTAWDRHVEWWEGDAAGDYNDASAIIREIIAWYDRGETNPLPRFFQFVEHLIKEGDEEVQNIAVVGYLETLQTAASWKSFGSEVFVAWMLPESKRSWAQIHQWWKGGKNLMDLAREEARISKDDADPA